MYSLLIILYFAFVSLGLPDSLIGAGWPVMHGQLDVPLSYAGILTMIIAGGTILSSLMSDRLTRRLGAGLVTAASVLMTAAALFGFSVAGNFSLLCLWAVPYGLGAGAVDAALNHYVALHYTSRHMSWLHCFWGVGTAISPYIMSGCLAGGFGWNSGYRWIAIFQVLLAAILFLSLPLWKRRSLATPDGRPTAAALSIREAVRIKGVKWILLTFFGYSALESTAGLWASTYLAGHRGLGAEYAAKYAALFFLGITCGRFLCGFVADRMGDKNLIRIGTGTAILGILLLGLPAGNCDTVLLGLALIGLGCAPVYPSIIHATPYSFGRENSQAVIGIQMASAYAGSTFMPPLFGLLADNISIGLYPIYLLFFAVLMFVMSEKLNKSIREKTMRGEEAEPRK